MPREPTEIFSPGATGRDKCVDWKLFYRGTGTGIGDDYTQIFGSGHTNTTSAVNAVRFNLDSGTLTSGKFVVYGMD